jgi:hypothetical protein
MDPFVCFLYFVFVSNFSILHGSVVSLPCPSTGLKGMIFSICFTHEINENSGSFKYGAEKSPGLGQCSLFIFKIFPPKHLHETESRSGFSVWGYQKLRKVQKPSSTHRVSSLRRDAKIEKFGMKTKF